MPGLQVLRLEREASARAGVGLVSERGTLEWDMAAGAGTLTWDGGSLLWDRVPPEPETLGFGVFAKQRRAQDVSALRRRAQSVFVKKGQRRP